jgi:hypothetical protein
MNRFQRGAIGLLAVALAACSAGINIQRGWISPDGTRVRLMVDACLADLQARVDEQPDRVVVRVMVVYQRGDRDFDCAQAVHFDLGVPLGARRLIDAWDGSDIPLEVDASLAEP